MATIAGAPNYSLRTHHAGAGLQRPGRLGSRLPSRPIRTRRAWASRSPQFRAVSVQRCLFESLLGQRAPPGFGKRVFAGAHQLGPANIWPTASSMSLACCPVACSAPKLGATPLSGWIRGTDFVEWYRPLRSKQPRTVFSGTGSAAGVQGKAVVKSRGSNTRDEREHSVGCRPTGPQSSSTR